MPESEISNREFEIHDPLDAPLTRAQGFRGRFGTAVVLAIVFLIALLFTFTRAITQKIYSDEQLFLGGAGLMARGNGLIYRDFFYNHMPTHALVLATLFKCTVHWTLAARTFDALCGAGIVALLFETARRSFVAAAGPWRILLGLSVAAIFLFNPVTADATGKAWNHNLAALSCLAGFITLAAGLRRERPSLWVLTSGMFAAIAATSRLTFAPPILAFVVFILIAPERSFAAKLKLLTLFTVGGLIGAAPALLVFAQSPANAYFENVKFPELTTRYQGELQRGARDTLMRKLDFIRRVGARSWALHVIFWVTIVAGAMALAAQTFRKRFEKLSRSTLFATFLLVLTSASAAFLPTPMYHQYLYGPVPFAVLLIAWTAGSFGLDRFWLARFAFVSLVVVCILSGRDQYAGLATLRTPATWTPNLWHKDAKRLARVAEPGKVLTFMPGLPLEGHLPIYDGLSIGRYATRIADYLTPEQRTKMNVPDAAAMRKWFEEDHPGAVLVVEPTSPIEATIADLAIEYGYTAQPFGGNGHDDWVLYLPPR